ncbi:MAG TPA: peroxiredoxin [Pyrinomonadaceae bacterium]
MTSDKTKGLTVGTPAPDFALPDGEGRAWHLADQRGKVVVLLFYPGDETPVCTKQMCSVRDHWAEYVATGAEVVGISTNSVESHRQFAAHHGLPLRLLADVDGRVRALYGALSLLPGRTARAVFVINADGALSYRDVRPVGLFRPRDEQIIAAIRQAQGVS